MVRNREVYKKKAAMKDSKRKDIILASIKNLEEQIEDLERILELDGDCKKFTID